MPSLLPQVLRQYLRGLHRAHAYPILLPHFTINDDGLAAIDGAFDPLPPSVLHALRLCDGTRKLSDIARQTGVSKSQLVQLHDHGRIIFWPFPASRVESTDAEITTVIVSPHPDDAALSAFTWMHMLHPAHGQPLILDVFSRATWWRFASPESSSDEIRRIRHAEEHLVTLLTGARLQMLDLPEALLRGYTMNDVFQAPVPARDAAVRAALAASIDALIRDHASALWLIPLGVGNHVDHLIARDEALAALERASVPSDRIFFYEDLPYAADLPDVPNFTNAIPGRHLRPGIRYRDDGTLKSECLRAYWSQLTWGQIQKVRAYAKRVGGVERTWQLMHDRT